MLDLEFFLQGDILDADHGYYLHSALSEIVPSHHHPEKRGNTGVHPIYGIPRGERKISLQKSSRLILRIEVEKIPEYLVLCGRTLSVGSHFLTVGMPASRNLTPTPILKSRMVTIKGFATPEEFLHAAQRQLADLNIQGTPHLVPRRNTASAEGKTDNREKSPFVKRTLNVKGKNIVGFALTVSNLTAEESLRLQMQGLGGRRAMGCGIFVPQR
jgi:CRISPR-associated protein Cas6